MDTDEIKTMFIDILGGAKILAIMSESDQALIDLIKTTSMKLAELSKTERIKE